MTDSTIQRFPALRSLTITAILPRLPIVGALIRDAGKSDEALIFALLNVAMLWIFAGFIWGLEGVLAFALALVPIVLGSLIIMMLSGGKAS